MTFYTNKICCVKITFSPLISWLFILLDKWNTFLKTKQTLGYDYNTVEFAMRNGVPYAIYFSNSAP
ncbi:MAG: hypothetical protein ACJAWH_002177 [Maribacter sp.]|jgi:hypothetical protein